MEDGELSALFDKLREMIALRTLGPADPRPGSPALSLDPPTARLRALAARFPGALRELDQAPLERLSARLAEVTVALAGGPSPDWALPVSRYHGWLRAALRLRAEAARDTAAAGVWAAASEGPRDSDGVM